MYFVNVLLLHIVVKIDFKYYKQEYMQNVVATKTYITDSDFKYNAQDGLRFARHYTRDDISPFDMFTYELRSSVIREPSGQVVFEMTSVEVPSTWSQVATDILAQKYFRKAGVPQYNSDGTPTLNENGSPVLGSEKSIKQVAHRLAGTWRYWGEKYGYFASQEDAQIFYDELVYMLIAQMVAPNSPQWFTTGLFWAYGINGPAQGHFYVDDVTGEVMPSPDAYSRNQPHACGRYNTKLFTEKGIVNLGEIVDENQVGLKIFDGEKFVKVMAVKNNGVKKIFKALLKNGNYIEFTDDHLVWSSDKRASQGGEYTWKELAEILGSKVQQISLDYNSKFLREDQLKIEKAELAGFVVGDGYYGKYGRNKKTTLFGAITINEDEYTRVTQLFKNIFGRYTVTTKRNINELYRVVHFDSKEADDFVNEYELNQFCSAAKIPERILTGSRAEKTAFLRGLFQADGCVRNRHSETRNCGDIVLTSISEDLMHEAQILLLELGIYSNVTPNSEHRENRKMSYQLSISYESERKKYAEIIGFISDEKKDKLEKLNLEVIGNQKNNISELTVVSIDYVGEEEVYDIQTESGKFCANGVVVHNCFIQSIKDDLVNPGGIMDLWVREARLFKYGSGTGTNFSNLRGSGEKLSGGGESSGLMSWLKIGDRAAGAIKSGGTTRRAAKMVILNIDHPDIEKFIDWKMNEEKKVAALISSGYDSAYEGEAYQTVSGQNSNNSIRVTQDFMEAVENNGDWNLTWRINGQVCKTLPAKNLWDKIATAAWSCADPGLQYDTNINDWHTCPQSGRIKASNPCCITGDTLIAVADGRNAVAIKDLVGQEVPVYAHDHSSDHTTISRMWNIGVKRQNAPIFRVTLDDGSSFRVTNDHLILMRDGTYKKVEELKKGESLMPFHSKVLAPAKNRTKCRFYWTGEGWKAQFRAVWNYLRGPAPQGHHIHHADCNALNDSLDNLVLLTAEEHNLLHSERMKGDSNPARRFMNAEWKKHIAEAVSGEKNPNYGHTHSEDTRDLMRTASAKRWSKESERTQARERIKKVFAKMREDGKHVGRHQSAERFEKSCPICRQEFKTTREDQLFCSLSCRYSKLGMGMVGPKTWNKVREKNQILRVARLLLDNGMQVTLTNWPKAKQFFASDDDLISNALLFNHKVVSVKFEGHEDVYDGTVDGHHNFAILTKSEQSCVSGHLNFSGIFVHNSEYMFLDDTACNLASINLGHFYDAEALAFDVEGFRYTTKIWTVVLEVSILMAQFPSYEIAKNSYLFRSLGLGYANVGSVLMTAGIPYDSPQAMGIAGAITALMTAESYATSAEMAKLLGPFAQYDLNKEDMLRVMRNHRRAAYNAPEDEYENLAVKPMGLDPQYVPSYLLEAAQESWDKALAFGQEFGYRNSQVTLLAPTGTIGLLMDCATTGVEPDFALVKFKKLAGGGYFKIVNESVPMALKVLGYTESQMIDIINYLRGRGTLRGAPHINHETLKEKGFTDEEIVKLEKSMPMVFELPFAFNAWTLGEDCLTRLGFTSEQYNDLNFNLLSALGFTQEQISAANEYVCGAMTIEGAPHLRKEHYAVFDTANKNGKKGQRYIHYLGHIRMMAAVQPFLSGAISKTINMPNEATIDDVKTAYIASWKLGLKAIALYRDGSKLSQPLSSKGDKKEKEKEKEEEKVEAKVEGKKEETVPVLATQIKYAHDGTNQGAKIYVHGEQRRLPYKRSGITIKTKVSGQKIFLRTGEYPDGKLGEIFIDMYREGAAFRSLLNLFAMSISTGLQYGVPLEEYVDKFTFTRFDPSGVTDHPNIRFCTSIIDFIFRVLGMEYLGRMDFVQVKPAGIQKNRAEQMEKIEAELRGQKTLQLGEKEQEQGQATLPNIPKVEPVENSQGVAADAVNQQLSGMMGDAPPCPTCGHITIRSGSCYKCLNCGSTTGCS